MKSSSVRKLIASVIVLTIVITLGILGHGRAVSMASESTAGDSVQTIQLVSVKKRITKRKKTSPEA